MSKAWFSNRTLAERLFQRSIQTTSSSSGPSRFLHRAQPLSLRKLSLRKMSGRTIRRYRPSFTSSAILKFDSCRNHPSALDDRANDMRDFQTVIASHRLGAERCPVREAIHGRVRCAMDCVVARAPRNDGGNPQYELRDARDLLDENGIWRKLRAGASPQTKTPPFAAGSSLGGTM